MNFILPTVITILSIIVIFILWWVSYPFILRYYIDSRDFISPVSIVNGSNGANGANGKNSPESRNGNHGINGVNSAGGAHGTNGRPGVRGPQGITGTDGEIGTNGTNGNQGIIGFDTIAIKENIFDNNEDPIYYVNGVPYSQYSTTLNDKAKTTFENQKSRLVTRIENTFKTDTNKIYFKKVLNNIVQNPVTIDVDPEVLDTLDKFNDFLDVVLSTYTAARDNIVLVKSVQLPIIDTNNNELVTLRRLRLDDVSKLNQPTYTTQLRLDLINPIQTLLTMGSRHYDNLESLKDPNVTWDSIIRDLNLELGPYETTYGSTLTTPSQKATAKTEIDAIKLEINEIRTLKNAERVDIIDKTNLIKEAFDDGTDLGTIRTVVFSDYSPDGATTIKANIEAATSLIQDAIDQCQIDIDTAVADYKTKNPV